MKNQNNFRPTQREIDDVTKRSRRDAIKGGLAGGLAGALVGRKYKAKLIGAGLGATAGDMIGRRVGRREGARDVVQSRQALLRNNQLAELREQVNELAARAEARDQNGNSGFPGASGQHPTRIYPKAKGPYIPGNGIDDQGEYELTEERQRLAEVYGWGIVSALEDDELTEANCQRLHDQVLDRQSRANGPHAGGDRSAEFERNYFEAKLGHAAVARMGAAEMHALFVAHRRNGLVELEDEGETTQFAIINRERNGEGQFVDNDLVSSQAIQRAYHPRDRRTGVETGGAGLAAGAAGLGALALLKGRKARRPRLPMGVPRLPAGSVDTNATTFGMGTVSKYPIKRRALRGKRPPTGIHPRQLGKAKKHSLAFLIHDDDFPLVPQPGQKLSPGMKRRVSPARTRKDVLARLKEITALASNFSVGSAVAETLIDAAGIGEATSPKKKRLVLDRDGNPINPAFLKDPGVTSTSSFASAIERLHSFGLGSSVAQGAARFAPEVAAIGIGDVLGETAHDRLKAAQDRKKKRLMRQRGGVEPLPGMGTAEGAMTTMSAVHDTLNEFAVGRERMDKARRDVTTVAGAGVGAGIGGYGALATYKPGRPAHPGEDLQGKRVFVKRKSAIPSYHVGVGGEDGVVHRSPGRGDFREVKRDTFRRNGAGGLRVEDVLNGKTAPANARAASAAAGTKSGKYGIGNNCEHGIDRILGGRGTSHQVRRGVAGLVGGAVVGGTMAEILNHKNRKEK